MTRSIKSAARPAVLAAVLSAGLLSGCSAGQIAQTAEVNPGVAGINTQAPDRMVYLRNATVDYFGPKGYPKGTNAPLALWIFNNTTGPITLTRVDGPAQVMLSNGANTAAPCAVPRSLPPVPATPTAPPPSSAAPSAGASSSASASGPVKPSGSVKPPMAAAPSVSPSPSPSQVGSTAIKVTIPAMGCVELSRRAAGYLQIVGLPAPLDNAGTVASVLHFADAAGQGFTIGTENQPLKIPVAVPESPLPRS